MCEQGVCKVKSEYIITHHVRELSLDCVSEKDKDAIKNEAETEPFNKRQKLSKSEKKKLRGQNKSRPATFKRVIETELCNVLIDTSENEEFKQCNKNNCGFMHDIQEYLKIKPKDIGDVCYNYENSGRCHRGLTCRFGSCHITKDGHNKVDSVKQEAFKVKGLPVVNNLSQELQTALRKRIYSFKQSESLVKYNDSLMKKGNNLLETVTTSGTVTNEDVIKLLQREKKAINWKNKLCLSPLTTVGNLPFRRICKEFGADVTCGEMAMCSAILQGAPQEWALLKRHHTEDIFGVQLCANNPHLLTKCGQIIEQELDVNFVDLNLGCPIDLVYREGGGCGLLRRSRVLQCCVRNLAGILSVPVTIKTRMGVYSNDNIAHTLIPQFKEWGASLVTVHGRSREQRYTKSADWNYIQKCVQVADSLPILGVGDILSYQDYERALEICPELTGVVVARGALIKPWIFSEIKERKLYDISSSERFDILKKYVNYGLEHWGSDFRGVENTRRFLLEWLSFLYRYVPVGLLEKPPQKINERPPYYRGRNDLETLMSSSCASDWIKISEMLLGPVPENFQFLPKHKANSYK